MAITRTEAASALRDVEETTARTHEMRGYRYASPHLIVWGAVWVVGYLSMGVLPQPQWGWVWLPLDVIGFVASCVLAGRMAGGGGKGGASGGMSRGQGRGAMAVTMLFVTLFACAIYVVFEPTRPEPFLVLPALLLGLVYVAAGVWKMRRLAWIGAAVFMLTMAGYLLFQPWLAFWIAGVGGGGLILGGLWLRRA
jgi:hypothetical protein